MSAGPCPDCGAPLVEGWCGHGFFQRGIVLARDKTGSAVRGPDVSRSERDGAAAPRRKHKPTPQKPPLKGRLVEPPAPKAARPVRDPATVGGIRSGMHCPECRAELLHQQPGALACPGCGLGYWMRGAELIPEGEHEAVEVPGTTLPRAQAKIRKRDD